MSTVPSPLASAVSAPVAASSTSPVGASTSMTTVTGKTVSHFSLGNLLATILMGAEDALIAYTNPAEIPQAVGSFTQGFLSTWFPTNTAAVNAGITGVATLGASIASGLATQPSGAAVSSPAAAAQSAKFSLLKNLDSVFHHPKAEVPVS